MESSVDYDQFLENIDNLVITEELHAFLNNDELLSYINCIYNILREVEQNAL